MRAVALSEYTAQVQPLIRIRTMQHDHQRIFFGRVEMVWDVDAVRLIGIIYIRPEREHLRPGRVALGGERREKEERKEPGSHACVSHRF